MTKHSTTWMSRTQPGTIALAIALLAKTALALPDGYLKYTVPLSAAPVGLAFDTAGVLYAMESAQFGSNATNIRVIQTDNTLDAALSITGDDPGNFFVGGMAYDPVSDGLLITDNTGDGRLYAVSKSGSQQTLATGVAGIAGVAVRSTGEIFVATAPGDNLGEVLVIDRITGNATPAASGIDFGADLEFDAAGDLLVQEADATTFAGRLHRLPITDGGGGLQFGSLSLLVGDMQSSAGLAIDSEGDVFSSGSGGLFSIAGTPLAETSFDTNGKPSQFAKAIAFNAGAQPFEPFAGADAGRLAVMADFGFGTVDTFVTFIKPTPPVNANFDGNGPVGGVDLAIWESGFGSITTATGAMGDADGNFDVDGRDFLHWQRQFEEPPQFFAGQDVPEPTMARLLGAAIAFLHCRQKRRSADKRAACG